MDKRVRVISHLIFLPAVSLAQTPKPIPAQQPLFGGLVGAGVGILVATQAVEKGETAPADYVGLFAIGGAVGGGLLGALVGRAFPKWHRLFP
jgi:hypothetical protein